MTISGGQKTRPGVGVTRVGARGWDMREFAAAGGTRFYAAVQGPDSAPPVVCVHGAAMSHRYFRPLARVLAPHAQAVAVDLPGFGLTRGPTQALDTRGLSTALADWLHATGRGRAVMVGQSTGCQVLIDMAVHSPDLLGPMVLIAPTVDEHWRSWSQQALRNPLHWPMEKPGLPLVLLRDYLDCGPRRMIASVRDFLHDPVERKAPLVDTTAVVVRGRLDPVTGHEWARRLAGLLPHGQLEEVPLASHTVQWTRPRAVAQIILDLLPEAGERPAEQPAASAAAPQFS